MTTPDRIEELVHAIDQKIREELRVRCEAYTPDFEAPEIFNVVTALLARQATLAIELASAPQLWNGHSAPLFLRAMTDVHITISWILLDPRTRARQYIDHGLGQAVLQLEHRKKNLETADEGSKEMLERMIKAEEAWIDSQRWHFLVDVNVGAWSGKSAREMAEEAGVIDFYSNVYIPFSQCVHSTWDHVGRYNSRPTDSALTGQIWLADIADSSSDVWNLHLAAKYLDKTFNRFDEKALGRSPASNVRDWIYTEITARFVEEKEKRESADTDTLD